MILLFLLEEILTVIFHPAFFIPAIAVVYFAKPHFLTLFLWAAVPVAALAAFVFLGDGKLTGLATKAEYQPHELAWISGYIISLIWTGLIMGFKALANRSRRASDAQ